MSLLLPKQLQTGDTIGFFSPSSPATAFAPKRFQRALSFLTDKGFKLQAGKLTGLSDHYRSGSIIERAEELNELIRDPKVRCIISTIGGYNSNSLLPYIDYQALINDPKIIIGYSDVTALLLGIYAQTGLVTFYGPALVASFGELPPFVDETFCSFTQVLTEISESDFLYQPPKRWTEEYIEWEKQNCAKTGQMNQWHFDGSGSITGRFIGGNLNTMAGIWGSPYMPEIKFGDILFIEDSLKGIESVERSFAHLKVCGVFDKVSAIVLGKHELFDDKGTHRTPLQVLKEVLNGQDMPILSGFDSCHTHPMLTVPIGVSVTIDFNQQSMQLSEPWLNK
ncbi:MAG: LD-carboxypeptidase [Aliivibrio sp.]|nr:LD-carboxypeptidase [Aliivibrio sp.]